MIIKPDTTVREVAGQVPRSRTVFQLHQIEWCCGGEGTLEDAARDYGVNLDRLIRELRAVQAASAAEAQGWHGEPLPRLVRHILDAHHRYLHRALPRIRLHLVKIIQHHGEKYGPLLRKVADLFLVLEEDLISHQLKEERILFPAILVLDGAIRGGMSKPETRGATFMAAIGRMELDHEDTIAALHILRGLTNGYTPPADAIPQMRAFMAELRHLDADLHEHFHLESNILFPRAVELEAGWGAAAPAGKPGLVAAGQLPPGPPPAA
ncbi:MAG: DUF542 domain-containing protein [Lentisphaeria bacterium]|jgi:regulator of cell morphogenesis and NO signaling